MHVYCDLQLNFERFLGYLVGHHGSPGRWNRAVRLILFIIAKESPHVRCHMSYSLLSFWSVQERSNGKPLQVSTWRGFRYRAAGMCLNQVRAFTGRIERILASP